jgi:hypothetical protein
MIEEAFMQVDQLPRRWSLHTSVRKALAIGAAIAGVGAISATSAPFQASLNTGLVNALNAIGTNLLGNAAFSATAPDPATAGDPFRIDIVADTLIPTAVGVFTPPDPCKRAVQISAVRNVVEGAPQVTILYDPTLVTPIPTVSDQSCSVFGDRTANSAFATKTNSGLINAMSSVGKNLLGDAVFSAVPGDPAVSGDPVRIDIAADALIPTAVGISWPPDPCRRMAQVGVVRNLDTGLTQVFLSYDSSLVTPVAGAIPPTPIDVGRCTVVN